MQIQYPSHDAYQFLTIDNSCSQLNERIGQNYVRVFGRTDFPFTDDVERATKMNATHSIHSQKLSTQNTHHLRVVRALMEHLILSKIKSCARQGENMNYKTPFG